MEILRETTVWNTDYRVPSHSYIIEGAKMYGFYPEGSKDAVLFKKPMSFSKSGRTFKKVGTYKIQLASVRRKVVGSKGSIYYVDDDARTCTCPGFTYRGHCKHLR